MDMKLSLIIDTDKLSQDWRRRIERLMVLRDRDIELMKTVEKLMEKTGNRISVVAREVGLSRMATYRLYERLGIDCPSPDPVSSAALKVCPFCGSEKWEMVKRLYHCLNPECGLEFRGPRPYRRYVFMSVDEPST